MNCNNKYCTWNAFDQCCPEDEESYRKAIPDTIDCPSSLRVDFQEQLMTLKNECSELLKFRNMQELISIKSFIESQKQSERQFRHKQ